MKIFKNIDELTIYDEYGVEYTKTQFLDEELAFMKKPAQVIHGNIN